MYINTKAQVKKPEYNYENIEFTKKSCYNHKQGNLDKLPCRRYTARTPIKARKRRLLLCCKRIKNRRSIRRYKSS